MCWRVAVFLALRWRCCCPSQLHEACGVWNVCEAFIPLHPWLSFTMVMLNDMERWEGYLSTSFCLSISFIVMIVSVYEDVMVMWRKEGGRQVIVWEYADLGQWSFAWLWAGAAGGWCCYMTWQGLSEALLLFYIHISLSPSSLLSVCLFFSLHAVHYDGTHVCVFTQLHTSLWVRLPWMDRGMYVSLWRWMHVYDIVLTVTDSFQS